MSDLDHVPAPVEPVDDGPRITRVEVIDGGRAYQAHDVSATFDIQDDGRTLKVFVTRPAPVETPPDAPVCRECGVEIGKSAPSVFNVTGWRHSARPANGGRWYGHNAQPPAPKPVVAPDLDAAWRAYHGAFDAMRPTAECRAIVEAAVTAQAAARVKVLEDALAAFFKELAEYSECPMCYPTPTSDHDTDCPIAALRVAATPTQEDRA